MASLAIHSVDYRFSKRIKDLREGVISDDLGAAVMRCAILDISGDGARLRPQEPAFVPDSFRLRLSPTLTIGCTVTDRGAGDIGVAFVEQQARGGGPGTFKGAKTGV